MANEETFKLANNAATYKAVQYRGTNGVTGDALNAYAKDNQLMDKDGNEVAGNGLYSYFDKDGKYKGGSIVIRQVKSKILRILKQLQVLRLMHL